MQVSAYWFVLCFSSLNARISLDFLFWNLSFIPVMIFVAYNSYYHIYFHWLSKAKSCFLQGKMKNLHKHFQSPRRYLFPWKSQWPLGTCFGIAHLQMGGYQLSWGRSLWLTGVLPRFLPKVCQVGHFLSLDRKADLVFINGSFYLQTVMYHRFQYKSV